jgi:dTDP-4-amino-4,6-dideoxygalactose transaminase
MRPIGGFFEWEFPPAKKQQLHVNAVYLNSGRHALEYILKGLGNIRCLWIPYFTCDAVMVPIQRLGVSWKFYHIDEKLEIADNLELAENEFVLYTNYYGIKDEYCKQLAKQYGEKLILDNAQALYCKSVSGTHQFYSPRKFMGMPDGGLAVTTIPDTTSELPIDKSFDRCKHLLKRIELAPSEGYNDFKDVSKAIAEAPLCQMSNLSKSIFASVDLDDIKRKRRENFECIHDAMKNTNRLQILSMDSFECPLVYPYWVDNGDALKKRLIERSIFVATYWPNVFEWCKPTDLEYELADHVVCIPIDQRYGKEDMEFIIKEIERC